MAEQQGGAVGGQMSAREEDAYGLSEAAVLLDQARQDQGKLASALDHNVEVWVAIRTLVSRDDNNLPYQLLQLREIHVFEAYFTAFYKKLT